MTADCFVPSELLILVESARSNYRAGFGFPGCNCDSSLQCQIDAALVRLGYDQEDTQTGGGVYYSPTVILSLDTQA